MNLQRTDLLLFPEGEEAEVEGIEEVEGEMSEEEEGEAFILKRQLPLF